VPAPKLRPRRGASAEVVVLGEQLAAAERRIAEDEELIDQAQRDRAEADAGARSAATELARWQAEKRNLDPDTRGRVGEVAVLWRGGTTAGERAAAEHELRRMVFVAATSFTEFLLLCRIERPVDWKIPAWAWARPTSVRRTVWQAAPERAAVEPGSPCRFPSRHRSLARTDFGDSGQIWAGLRVCPRPKFALIGPYPDRALSHLLAVDRSRR
jgi:hypothetical protein